MEIKNFNQGLIWKGKAGEFKGWAKAMEDNYGKDTLLVDVIKDMKTKRIERQIKYIKDKFEETN